MFPPCFSGLCMIAQSSAIFGLGVFSVSNCSSLRVGTVSLSSWLLAWELVHLLHFINVSCTFVVYQGELVFHIAPKMWFNRKNTGNISVEGFSWITQGLLVPKLCFVEREWGVADETEDGRRSMKTQTQVLEMELMSGMVTTSSWDLGLCDLT